VSEKTESIINNQILAAIPQSEYLRIAPYLEQVSFSSGQILQELDEPIKEVYFPYQAMISLVSIMSDGSITEIGLVGNEGMVGLPVILGGDSIINRSIVQISGAGVKLPTRILQEEFQRGETLQRLLLLYTQALLTQVAQTAACNSQHSIKQRLARWLLSVQDCVLSNELLLTQEFIGQMLGIRRSGVTVAAKMLQQAGIIRYNRGHITIIDQKRLEETACECYLLVHKEFQRLLYFRPK
jgi:CRP-like cAMP-binding protein